MDAIVTILTTDVTVAALVSDRVSPITASAATELPHITYERTADEAHKTLSGTVKLRHATIRITCWADGYAAARVLANAVVAALDSYQGTVGTTYLDSVSVSIQADDMETTLEGEERAADAVALDVSVWYKP